MPQCRLPWSETAALDRLPNGDSVPRSSDALRLVGVSVATANIQFIRDLKKSEAGEYCDAVEFLADHARASLLIQMAQRNLNDFENARGSFSRKIPVPGKRAILQREATLELNRLFLNFLASVRQFLDHTETRIKRRYANHPSVLSAFESETRKAFDSSFAYRFLYKLRNFGLHCGAPIGTVDIESSAIGASGITLHKLLVKFEPAQLLKDGHGTWGKVRRDLEMRRDPFDVEPLAKEAMQSVEHIWTTVRGEERPILREAADRAVHTVADVPARYRSPAVVRMLSAKKMSFVLPPFDTMEWLGIDRFKPFL